ncbi:MAG: hypothetical protein WDA20_14165 [Desulfuromonadales bacterium]
MRMSSALAESIIPEEAGFELLPSGAGRYEIRIWGRFAPGWLGAFTAGLAKEHLNILQGAAQKMSAATWQASFHVESRGSTASLDRIDFLALASGRPAAVASAVSLESFAVGVEADGALRVDVRAADQLGFLTSILKNFALFSLFPAELRIETTAGRVADRFWLRGVGGASPSAETAQALREILQARVMAA